MATAAWDRDPEAETDVLLSTLQEKANRLHVSTEELDELGVFERDTTREEWVSIATHVRKEQEQATFEAQKDRIQEAIRSKLIRDWLSKNLKDLSGDKRVDLFHLIENGSKAEQTWALRLYLVDVLKLGIEEAERRSKRRNRGGWLGLTWTIVQGLFKLTVVLLVLLAARTPFEQMALAILILLYSNVTFYVQGHGIFRAHDGAILTDLLNRVRILLHDPLLRGGWEPPGEWVEEISRNNTKLVISSFVNLLMQLVAFGFLVFALLNS